ncbi:2683_t:CDS:2 [Entrophospora sp. SA101]|nr:2683_t:CDS:2 [Entrophospora sp. SA101]
MTKDQLAQEIKQEFAKGNFKPSQLKRSKSTGDISPTPPLPNIPLKKSPSQPETSQTLSPEQEISQLQEQIKFHAQTSQNYLQSLQAAQAKITELEEELQAKEAFVDASEENPAELKAQIANLEQQILELRLKNLKDFGEYYEEKKALKGELEENIDEGVQEIRRKEIPNGQELCRPCQAAQNTIQELREEIRILLQDPNVETLLNQQREKLRKLEKENKLLEEDLQQWTTKIREEDAAEVAELKIQIRNREQALEQEKNKVQGLEQKLQSDEKTQLDTSQQTHAQTLQAKQREIQQIELNLTQKTNELTQAQTNLAQKTTELTQELTKNQQLQQNLTELQKTLTVSQTSTANLRQEMEELKKVSVSKKELETEQKRLQISKEVLQKQITENRKQEQTIEDLEKNLAKSEEVLKETSEQLAQAQQESTELAQQKEQLQKDLTKSLQQLAQIQETQPLLEQKIVDLEQSLLSLAKQKLKGKKEAQELLTQLETNCQTHQETLTRKSKELSKLRIEVVELENQASQQIETYSAKAKETAWKPVDYYRKQEAFYRVSPSPKRFTFPPKEELERVRKRIARPGYRRVNIGLLPNATESDKVKYHLCLNISRYQDENDLSEKELAQRLGVNKAKTEYILFRHLDKLTLEELINYLEELHLPQKPTNLRDYSCDITIDEQHFTKLEISPDYEEKNKEFKQGLAKQGIKLTKAELAKVLITDDLIRELVHQLDGKSKEEVKYEGDYYQYSYYTYEPVFNQWGYSYRLVWCCDDNNPKILGIIDCY